MGGVWCCEGWGWEECGVVSVDELPSVCAGGGAMWTCLNAWMWGESLSLREWCAWPGTGAITGML